LGIKEQKTRLTFQEHDDDDDDDDDKEFLHQVGKKKKTIPVHCKESEICLHMEHVVLIYCSEKKV